MKLSISLRGLCCAAVFPLGTVSIHPHHVLGHSKHGPLASSHPPSAHHSQAPSVHSSDHSQGLQQIGTTQSHRDSLVQSHSQAGGLAQGQQHQATALSQGQQNQVHGHAGHKQTPTTVQHEGFFQRLQDSLTSFIFGIVLIVFSFPVLWLNESRTAKMESLIARGESEGRTVSGKQADKENRNSLVHIQGAEMKSAAKIEDSQFSVSFDSDCIRLQSLVEVYQWVEHEHREEKEKLGGGKEVITSYTYAQEWSSNWHDSSGFQDRSKVNHKPSGLQLGSKTKNCSRVEYGGGFMLTDSLISGLHDFKNASERIGQSVSLASDGTRFDMPGNRGDHYYFKVDHAKDRDTAKAGDARVSFQYVPDGPATVVALQVEREEESGRDTFLPYRIVKRGLCGISPEQEKRDLRRMAEKSREDLASDDQCGSGLLWCCCCACNIVTMCCSGALVPEIYHIFTGSRSFDECFQKVKEQTRTVACCFRVAGWLMMFIGFYLLFAPFLTFIKIIPFLGPILSKLGGFVIGFCSLILTAALSCVVMTVAYLVYHPLKAILYGTLTAAIIVVPLVLIRVL